MEAECWNVGRQAYIGTEQARVDGTGSSGGSSVGESCFYRNPAVSPDALSHMYEEEVAIPVAAIEPVEDEWYRERLC